MSAEACTKRLMGVIPPPLTPPHKGEGKRKRRAKLPSSFWGGGGGGAAKAHDDIGFPATMALTWKRKGNPQAAAGPAS